MDDFRADVKNYISMNVLPYETETSFDKAKKMGLVDSVNRVVTEEKLAEILDELNLLG